LPEGEHEIELNVLLDQNVPRAIGAWLENLRPYWNVAHVSQVGLEGKSDLDIFGWSQENGYLIVTFDEDFADQRQPPAWLVEKLEFEAF
jgi:predicted nuclease of predicted toxin-antitoxin system